MGMLNKFYEIDFTDGTRIETLRYQIVDTPVAELWLDRVRWHLALPDCHIFANQWIVTLPTLEKVQSMWRNMKKLVDEANSGQYIQVSYIDMEPEFNPKADNRKILNYLHLQFHQFEEELRGKIVGYDPLQELNVEIHRIEAMLDRALDNSGLIAGDVSCGFFLHGSAHTAPISGTHTVPIDDMSLYQYWQHNTTFGDLLLGYHTVGKNLEHCWRDGDIDLVKTGMLRPQQTVSNEVVLAFRGNDVPSGAREWKKEVDAIQQWVKDNDLAQYVDMSQPYHNISGRPLLGRIVGDYTIEEINEIFELGRIKTVRLIE